MLTVIAIVHIIACFLLISLVLLQDPKSTGGSAMFGGGGTNNVLGATSGATLLQKLTRYAAIVFGICCLVLTILSRREFGSVFDTMPATSATSKKTAPLEAPAATIPEKTPVTAPSNLPGAAAPAAPQAPSPSTSSPTSPAK